MARKRTNLIGNTPSVRETKVAIYIRVSTIHQVDKDSIPMQKKDLIAYCSSSSEPIIMKFLKMQGILEKIQTDQHFRI